MASIVRRVRAPMLLAKVAVFLGMSFPWDSGTLPVPGRYVPFLSLCKGFSSQEATDSLDLSWLHTCSGETEGANACPHESHLSCEGWTDPATCTGTFVTRWIGLGEGAGARAEQCETCPQQPFSLWLS